MKKSILISTIFLLFFTSCLGGVHYNMPVDESRVYMGLESFVKWGRTGKYAKKRCILVTNHSGFDRKLNSNIQLLRAEGIDIFLVMAPEHGLYGYQNDYAQETSWYDKSINLTVYNLHKLDTNKFRTLAADADIVIFDIQDMGMRCYTYISNLKFIMDALSGTGKELIVLDRPNPIGFLGTSGAFLESRFTTRFVSAFPAPFVYNMTMGEAAQYYKGEYAKDVKLTVYPLVGYKRKMYFHDTAMPWVPPSPNLPTYKSSIVYSAVVLMECINMSIGRGTPMPFEYLGAPWIDPVKFCKDLEELDLGPFIFRPTYFTPNMRDYSGQTCGGAQIIYIGGKFDPTEFSYKVIQYLLANYPQARWDIYKDKYEIDAMAGTDKFRLAITNGLSYKEFYEQIKPGIKQFEKKRRKYLLYW